MLRFIWREINNLADLKVSLAELSCFSEACIGQSVDFIYEKLIEDFGAPESNGKPEYNEEASSSVAQTFNVIAMGKLGGGELNLSSDIDLIFFFQHKGKTTGKRSLDNQQFFTRLAQVLIKVLDERTAEGYVFRVDMRLRPYGESGQLVLSQQAMEHYYEAQGRAWERYAFIKARLVAGDPAQAEPLMQSLQPFVYRRYIDFSVVESLREMKALINRQVKTKNIGDDIKLGEGGIRELEFIAQALQLIQGGKNSDLQQRSYFSAMRALVKASLISDGDAGKLISAYRFLRKSEHLLQAQEDKQTQLLPVDEFERDALGFLMGFETWQEYKAALDEHRQ